MFLSNFCFILPQCAEIEDCGRRVPTVAFSSSSVSFLPHASVLSSVLLVTASIVRVVRCHLLYFSEGESEGRNSGAAGQWVRQTRQLQAIDRAVGQTERRGSSSRHVTRVVWRGMLRAREGRRRRGFDSRRQQLSAALTSRPLLSFPSSRLPDAFLTWDG